MGNVVLSLDQTGTAQRWIGWEDAVLLQCKDLILWSLGEQTVYRGGVSSLTGNVSTVSVPSIVAVKGVAKNARAIATLTNRNLFGRDRNMCAYCGVVLPFPQLTRDHIIPVSRKGKNTWMNCVTACKSCNCKKDDNLLSEINMQLLYVPYVPCKTEALILANRNIKFDQMEYLMKHLPKHSRLHS